MGRERVDGEWEDGLRGVGVNVVERGFGDAVVDIDFEEAEGKGSWLRMEGRWTARR